MKIIFVRHGQTSWNFQGKLQGQLDIPLDKVGFAQTKTLSAKLKKEKIDIIFSSPLIRALDTAIPVANTFNMSVISTSLVSERNFGILQGIRLKEIDKNTETKVMLQKTIDPFYKPYMGESLEDLQKRILKFLTFLNEFDNSTTILCVTHGGVLDLIYRFSKNKPINTPRDWIIPNTGINTFSYSNKKLELQSWAETDHLKKCLL